MSEETARIELVLNDGVQLSIRGELDDIVNLLTFGVISVAEERGAHPSCLAQEIMNGVYNYSEYKEANNLSGIDEVGKRLKEGAEDEPTSL